MRILSLKRFGVAVALLVSLSYSSPISLSADFLTIDYSDLVDKDTLIRTGQPIVSALSKPVSKVRYNPFWTNTRPFWSMPWS